MNITVDRKVIEQALEEWHTDPGSVRMASLMIALRTALGHQYMTNAAGELEPVTIVQTGVGIWKLEQEPVGWLYPEGLAALKAGKCWTAYGTKQDDDNNIPIFCGKETT